MLVPFEVGDTTFEFVNTLVEGFNDSSKVLVNPLLLFVYFKLVLLKIHSTVPPVR